MTEPEDAGALTDAEVEALVTAIVTQWLAAPPGPERRYDPSWCPPQAETC